MKNRVCLETVHSYECGADCLMKPDALLHWIQEVAEEHANTLGFGYDFCMKSGCAWVETGITARIKRWPRWKEKVEVETWTFPHSPVIAARDFKFRDAQGELIIEASTLWGLISMNKRRPVPLKRIVPSLMEAEGTSLLSFPDERDLVWDSASARKFHAENHEVDFNGHINNSSYLNWALDSLMETDPSLKKLKGLTIRFLKETMPGMQVESRSIWQGEKLSFHRIFSEVRDRAHVFLEWT